MHRIRIESLGASLPRRGLFRWGSVKHAVVAGQRCLEKSKYNPNDVRVLVNTGVHRDGHTCEPAMAAYVQHGLDINVEFQGRRTLSFDLLNGACGMLNGVHLVSSLIQAGEAHVGMVVSSEANGDAKPDPAYTFPASGAAVLLDVSPQRSVGFGEFAFQTHEEHAGLFTSVVSLAVKRGRILLKRQAEVEDVWLRCSAGVVDEVLAKEKLGRSEIDLVVPPQVSKAFLQKLPQALGVPAEKVLDLTSELADTHSTSTFLALHQAVASGRLPKGKRALLLAVGSGVTVGAATYRT